MTLTIKPVFRSLMRNRAGPLLVAFQIAVALAVLVNAVFMAEQRIAKMSRPTGIDDRHLFSLRSVGFTPRFDFDAALRADLAYIRSVPGVVAATPISAVPLSQSGSAGNFWTRSDHRGPGTIAAFYDVDDQGLKTLGVHLLAGRGFRPDEILPLLASAGADPLAGVPEMIITRSLARTLFPAGHALGRAIYNGEGHPVTIIGVIDDMAGPGYASSFLGYNDVILVPRLSAGPYLVRTLPGRRDAVMRTVEDHLAASNADRVITDVHSLDFYEKLLYVMDRNMAIFLITVTALLVVISCVGIFSLVTFSVARRTKQIGVRRAVGARRVDVVRHFLLENALITTAGVLVGCALALGAGYWLSVRFALPRLDLYYLVGGVLVLWSVGQLAAWHPARRAAQVPPSVATRTV